MNYEDEFTWLKSLNFGGSNELFARIQSRLKRVVRKDVVHGGLNSSAHIYASFGKFCSWEGNFGVYL